MGIKRRIKRFINNRALDDPQFAERLRIVKKTSIRLSYMLGITMMISLIYTGAIRMGLFQALEANWDLYRVVFCTVELLLLAGYWLLAIVFSGKSLSRSRDLKEYYRIAIFNYIVYTAVIIAVCRLNLTAFIWLFRITLNLTGITYSHSPSNLTPYLLVFLAITGAIMMASPLIEKLRYKAWKKRA